MCDYSLHAQPTRLAQEGDRLILHRFNGGSLGFVSREELERHTCCQSGDRGPRLAWNWNAFRNWFRYWTGPSQAAALTAVCLPPGARLQLDDIPQPVQQNYGVSRTEQVTFTQLGLEAYTYRDAVRFNNGKEVLLQRLTEKQRAIVLSMGGNTENTDRGLGDPVRGTLQSNRA